MKCEKKKVAKSEGKASNFNVDSVFLSGFNASKLSYVCGGDDLCNCTSFFCSRVLNYMHQGGVYFSNNTLHSAHIHFFLLYIILNE